jgi:hypothetical protein
MKIVRPNNEACYSEEDLAFIDLIPEPHDEKYYEIFLKLNYYEKNKKHASLLGP